jgi:hypothetical protein
MARAVAGRRLCVAHGDGQRLMVAANSAVTELFPPRCVARSSAGSRLPTHSARSPRIAPSRCSRVRSAGYRWWWAISRCSACRARCSTRYLSMRRAG